MATTDSSGGWFDELFSFDNFKPWRVGLSMAASWSMGVSMAAGISILMTQGRGAFGIWAVFNTLTVPIFAAVHQKWPEVQQMYDWRLVQVVMLFVLVTQVSLNQQAVFALLGGGVELVSYQFLPTLWAKIVTIAITIGLMTFIYFKGLPGSITTDVIQYTLQLGGALLLAVLGITFGFESVEYAVSGPANFNWAWIAAIGLVSGPFVDATQWQRIERAPEFKTGLWAGLFFGIYAMAVYAASTVLDTTNPVLAGLFLIAVLGIATSTLDSIAAALQDIFGGRRKVAWAVGVGAACLWPLVLNNGLTTLWTMFVTVRAWVVGGLLVLVAINAYVLGNHVENPITKYNAVQGRYGEGGKPKQSD